MIDVEKLKVTENLVEEINGDEDCEKNKKLKDIQSKCDHEIGILLRKQFVSDYDISIYKCLNCAKMFIGEQVKALNLFKNVVDFSYIDDNFDIKYKKISKCFYLQRKYDKESSDEELSSQIDSVLKKVYYRKEKTKDVI